MKKRFGLFVFLFLVNVAFAHENDFGIDEINEVNEFAANGFFEDFLPLPPVVAIILFSFIPFLILYFTRKKITRQHIYFWIIIYFVGAITLVIIFDTINLAINSETKGPVHWHADFQIWKCGEKLDLVNPEGLANRVGSRLFHEHGDGRMHVEGIIEDVHDVDLHNFFNFIGGNLSESSFKLPTNHDVVEVNDGDLCNGERGEVQIFSYIVDNANARQKSGFLAEQYICNENYIISPYQDVPPGDCIIIEFDKRKNKTDKICDTYKLAVEQNRMAVV